MHFSPYPLNPLALYCAKLVHDEGKIPIGSLNGPDFAIWTVHELVSANSFLKTTCKTKQFFLVKEKTFFLHIFFPSCLSNVTCTIPVKLSQSDLRTGNIYVVVKMFLWLIILTSLPFIVCRSIFVTTVYSNGKLVEIKLV